MTSSILLTILALLAPQAPKTCLPTGACLDPAGRSFAVGNMPLAVALSPEGDRFVVSLNGWREQGVQVVDRATGAILQTLPQPAAFFGLAFSPDGRTLYASGGNDDVVYRYDWSNRTANLRDRIVLTPKEPGKDGTRFPAGLAVSADGRVLYVAENLADSLAVVDAATGQVVERRPTGPYPYAVALSPDGRVYVSAWGGDAVSAFSAGPDGRLTPRGEVRVGRHPSALALSRDGSRLFVASASTNRIAVVDTRRSRVVATLADPPPAGPNEGSTPDALALSPDGTRLFVAEADNNAVAVFDLSRLASGVAAARGRDRLSGRVPVEWYPTGVLAAGDSLYVLNGKGRGTRPNPKEGHPGSGDSEPHSYTLGQLDGTISVLPLAISPAELGAYTGRVARANNWTRGANRAAKYPPFKHVVYVIKENRTYDQVLADMPQGDGDRSLLFFPRPVSPNHHALAERFGLFDRFFVNAEVSSQGHPWSTSAYVTDYTEKTVPSGASFGAGAGSPYSP
jgi:YVTN family beta-propeller protein